MLPFFPPISRKFQTSGSIAMPQARISRSSSTTRAPTKRSQEKPWSKKENGNIRPTGTFSRFLLLKETLPPSIGITRRVVSFMAKRTILTSVKDSSRPATRPPFASACAVVMTDVSGMSWLAFRYRLHPPIPDSSRMKRALPRESTRLPPMHSQIGRTTS